MRVALIGPLAARLAGDAAARAGSLPPRRFDTLAACLGAPPAERGADVALLTLDALGTRGSRCTRALERALGSACRVYPARLLLLVDTAEAVPPEALFAFGFRRLAPRPDAVLHEYRLRDYKTPPEWLNARFWANPERFGLDVDEVGESGEGSGDEEE